MTIDTQYGLLNRCLRKAKAAVIKPWALLWGAFTAHLAALAAIKNRLSRRPIFMYRQFRCMATGQRRNPLTGAPV
jgi:hypothetical protein